MGVAEIVAFFRALPELVRVLSEVVSALQQLKQDAINKELESIKSDVDAKIQILITAKSDEQRKQAILDLSRTLGR